LGETNFLGAAASNGTSVSALDDRRVWSIGRIKPDRGEPKCSEKILSQYQFFYHKSHIDYSEVEPRTLG
jgi:hypothetical protein